MQLTITGKNLDIGDALRQHIRQTMENMIDKYTLHPLQVTVIVTKEAQHFVAEVQILLKRNMHIAGHATGDQPYQTFDTATEHIIARIRRHKERIRDHQKHRDIEAINEMAAQSYVLSPDLPDAAEHDQPLVIAEMATEIPTLSVSEAVMRLDLAAVNTLMFKNSAHGRLNVVYRRPDHNIGWIDPSL